MNVWLYKKKLRINMMLQSSCLFSLSSLPKKLKLSNLRFRWFLYTYIHNWPLQSFSQDCSLAFHSTHVVVVNFIHEWWDLQFNVYSERQICEKLFHGRFILLSEFLPEICWEEIAEEILFIFHFWWLTVGCEPRLLRQISQHTTY